MKVCDISNLYYPHGGGIKTYIEDKRTVYRMRGIDHVLIAPNVEHTKELKTERNGSTVIYYMPCFKLTLFGTPYYIFSGFKKITEILKKEQPNIIELGDKTTTLLYKNSIRRLHHYFTTTIFAFSHERADNFSKTVTGSELIGGIMGRIFLKRFIDSADVLLTNSAYTAEEMQPYVSTDTITVIKLGIDVTEFSKDTSYDAALYQRLSDKGTKTLLIHVGRLDTDKKIDLLVAMAAELDVKRYKLIIVGAIYSARCGIKIPRPPGPYPLAVHNR